MFPVIKIKSLKVLENNLTFCLGKSIGNRKARKSYLAEK
jgi:hypothetical protein